MKEERPREQAEYLTIAQTAKILSCSPRTIYTLLGQGRLKGYRLTERLVRIQRSDIDQFVQSCSICRTP
jgi:excisionase family DNA binding protein